MDPDKLLYRLNSRKKLKVAELEEVVALLTAQLAQGEVCWDDCYGLILVVQKAGAHEQHTLIASFLDQRDSLLVSLALETLCLEWRLTEEYLERVMNFSLGVPWDLDGDLRNTAFYILGEYVGREKDGLECSRSDQVVRRTIRLLLKAFEDKNIDIAVRRGAYRALCSATRFAAQRIPSGMACFSVVPGSPEIDWEMVNQWRKLCGSDSSESSSPAVAASTIALPLSSADSSCVSSLVEPAMR